MNDREKVSIKTPPRPEAVPRRKIPIRIKRSDLEGLPFHSKLTLTELEGDKRSWVGCGNSWCRGECSLPLLRVSWPKHPSFQMRVFGPQAAFGPVVQEIRRPWQGEEIHLPEEVCVHLREMTWV